MNKVTKTWSGEKKASSLQATCKLGAFVYVLDEKFCSYKSYNNGKMFIGEIKKNVADNNNVNK